MTSMEVLNEQNVVSRVANLPLVSSTYDLMSKVYLQTKDQHPYLKSVCEVAELGVKTVTSVAFSSALPIIDKLPITKANDLACKGLDRIEKKLPILHQPSEQVVATAKDTVNGAKEAVSDTVSGAKDTVTSAVTGMVGLSRGAVQGSVDLTRAAVTGGVSMVKESRVAQLVSSGVDTALSTSESLVEQYLPHSNQEIRKASKAVKGFENGVESSSYYNRLGSLSTKLRQRTYQRAVAKVCEARQHSHESIAQLHLTMDLIESARKNINDANQKMTEKLWSRMDWKVDGQTPEKCDTAVIESQTLALARGLSQQLQTTCQGLLSSVQGLPHHIQDQALTLTHLASELYTNFSQAGAFGDLSESMLSASRTQLHRLRETLDDAMDYLVNNTPLNWLVGPFYPHMDPAAGGSKNGKPQSCGGDDAHLSECSLTNFPHPQFVHRDDNPLPKTSMKSELCDMKAKKQVVFTQ